MARIDRAFDPVQIVQVGDAVLGLEGAEATRAGAVVLWGWLVDPQAEVGELWCELHGRTVPLELLDRITRPDLADMLAPLGSVAEPGFLAVAQVEPDQLRDPDRRIAMGMSGAGGSAVSRNRLAFHPLRGFTAGVGRRLPIARMRPAAIARVVATVRGPMERRTLEEAGRGAQISEFGPAGDRRLSLVLPIQGALPLSGEYGVLRQTLAYLDMEPDAADLELVLVLTDPELWTQAETAIMDAATGLSIRAVRPGEQLSVGIAAALGVEAASAPQVVLMSEAVVPPARDWIAEVRDTLQLNRWGGPKEMPRFDGTTHRFQLRTAAQGGAARPHDHVRLRLADLMRQRGLDGWSPNLVAGDRQQLLRATVEAAQVGGGDAFWVALLDEALRGGAAPLASGARFTFVPGRAADDGHGGTEDLLDAYALAAHLEAPRPAPSSLAATPI